MKNKNLYKTIGVNKNATDTEIKSSYRKLSFLYHPDKNRDNIEAENMFKDIAEAYKILSNIELKEDYDLKSKFGKNYNEYLELFDISVDFTHEDGKEQLERFKRNEINNIQIDVDDTFNGKIEYERWVCCKSCAGSGKDMSGKIIIRDIDGNITKIFDSEDGCDFCEGIGKGYDGLDCSFCVGQGKVGLTTCESCSGNGRIMGKQKLTGIKLTGEDTKIDTMGHFSKNGVGYLLIKKLK